MSIRPGSSGDARLPVDGLCVAVVLYLVPGLDRSMLVPGLRPHRREVELDAFRFVDDLGSTLTHDLATPVTISSHEHVERLVTISGVSEGAASIGLEARRTAKNRWLELGLVNVRLSDGR